MGVPLKPMSESTPQAAVLKIFSLHFIWVEIFIRWASGEDFVRGDLRILIHLSASFWVGRQVHRINSPQMEVLSSESTQKF